MPPVDLHRPVALPPPGVVSNFLYPDNKAALAYGSVTASILLVTFYTWFRILVKDTSQVDPLTVIDILPFAWATAIVHFAAGLVLYDFAPIVHSWDMQFGTFLRYLLYFRLSWIFYNISILLIKVAMLIQILRIFVPRGSHSRTYYVIHTLMWTTVAFYTIMTFLHIFTCRPFRKLWQPFIEGKCLDTGILAVVIAVVNVFTDLCILAIAQRAIWKTMIRDRARRLRISLVFYAGIIPCAFSGLCLYYNYRAMKHIDFVHESALMALACYGEIVTGMFVLFLPVLPRFFMHVKESVSQYTRSGKSDGPGHSYATTQGSEQRSRTRPVDTLPVRTAVPQPMRAHGVATQRSEELFAHRAGVNERSYLSDSSSAD